MITAGAVPGLTDFVGAEEPSERRRQAERRKVVVGHEQAARALDAAALPDVERDHAEREQAVHGAQPFAQVAIFGPRGAGIQPGFRLRLDELQRRGARRAVDRR